MIAMFSSKSQIQETLLVIFFIAIVCSSALTRIDLPAFWDEPKIYIGPLFAYAENLALYFSEVSSYDRPLGTYLLYWPAVKLLGPSVLLVRVMSLSFFVAGLVLLYLQLRRFDRTAALTSLAIISVTTLFLVYAPQFVGDPQLFFLFSLYGYLLSSPKKPLAMMFILGLFIGFYRESGLALVPATGLYWWSERRKISLQEVFVVFAPLGGGGMHLLRNYLLSGEFFPHVIIASGSLDLLTGPAIRWRHFAGSLISSYQLWPLAITSGCLACVRKSSRPKIGSYDLFAIGLVVCFVVVFTSMKISLPRYFMSAVPFMIYLLVRMSVSTLRGAQQLVLAGGLVLLSFASGICRFPMIPSSYSIANQDSFEYPAMIEKHRGAIKKLRASVPPGAVVMTSWPFLEMLRREHLGYGAVVKYQYAYRAYVPAAMLWTDFPEQIPRAEIEKNLARAKYSQFDFSYGRYKVYLYIKD